METITNATMTKCQSCGEWTNYAGDAHHQTRQQWADSARAIAELIGADPDQVDPQEVVDEVGRVFGSLPKTGDEVVVVPGMTLYFEDEDGRVHECRAEELDTCDDDLPVEIHHAHRPAAEEGGRG